MYKCSIHNHTTDCKQAASSQNLRSASCADKGMSATEACVTAYTSTIGTQIACRHINGHTHTPIHNIYIYMHIHMLIHMHIHMHLYMRVLS